MILMITNILSDYLLQFIKVRWWYNIYTTEILLNVRLNMLDDYLLKKKYFWQWVEMYTCKDT